MIVLKKNDYRRISYHREIWLSVAFLCILGLLMIYSASGSFDYFKRQGIFMLLGFFACFIFQTIDYHLIYPYAGWIYLASLLCIFLLLTPAGVSVNGATRWLRIGGVQFQVAEAVKIGVIVMLSYLIHRFPNSIRNYRFVFLMWGLGGVAAGLLMIISNDLSSSIVVLGITFLMTFVFTELWVLHVGVFGGGITVVGLYVYNIWRDLPSPAELEHMSFRVGRIAAWLDPYRYESDQSFQTLQALYAIGRGGKVGVGLGNSMQKFMIPEPHTDMIFSILCEELGGLGVLVLFSLLTAMIYYLIRAGIGSKDRFGYAIVTGVASHIAVQSIINLAVNINVFPNTGIALPFISYGGTAVFTMLCEISMCLSVERISSGLYHFKIERNKGKISKFSKERKKRR